MKKRMFLSFVVVALVASMMMPTAAFAADPFDRESGRIIASVGGIPQRPIPDDDCPRAALFARIAYAQLLFDNCEVAPANRIDTTVIPGNPFAGGPDGAAARTAAAQHVPIGQMGMTLAAHNAFRDAIAAARIDLEDASVAPGGYFDVVIGIEGNTGFAGMIMQLGFPSQLEVVGFGDNHGAFPVFDFLTGFQGPRGYCSACMLLETPPLVCPTGACTILPVRTAGGYGYFHVGWAGRLGEGNVITNFTHNAPLANGGLFTFRVRVSPTAAPGTIIDPITIAISNAIYPFSEMPSGVDADGNHQDLRIFLPDGRPGGGLQVVGNLGEIGQITVR